ncbi:hypothetical protein ABZ519_36175 [Streptomyces collinus]|uniref:hypothetical protein n=1 Tax=Streptomyces collinus TaxID=42684 RepID=UPI0033E14CC6
MRDPIDTDARLALDLALTVRHDGNGGFADDLTAPAGSTVLADSTVPADLAAWVRAHPEILPLTARDRSDDKDSLAATADSARRGDHEGIATGTARLGTAPQPAAGDGGTAGFTADAARSPLRSSPPRSSPPCATWGTPCGRSSPGPCAPASPSPRTRAASCRGVQRCGSSTRRPCSPEAT